VHHQSVVHLAGKFDGSGTVLWHTVTWRHDVESFLRHILQRLFCVLGTRLINGVILSLALVLRKCAQLLEFLTVLMRVLIEKFLVGGNERLGSAEVLPGASAVIKQIAKRI
jgi:hypothetical protein